MHWMMYEPSQAVLAEFIRHPALQLAHMFASCVVQAASWAGEPFGQMHTFAV